jgi:class 3 adenylate cyclase
VMYMLHNRENIRQEMVAAEEIVAGRRSDVHEVTVGFCDVVGFTRLGEGVAVADLGAIATRLAALAADAAEPPVRLIKTIGDAAMFVAPEPAPLLDTMLCLMEAAEREGEQFPSLHAGAAHGPALRRWGANYGTRRKRRRRAKPEPRGPVMGQPAGQRAARRRLDAGLERRQLRSGIARWVGGPEKAVRPRASTGPLRKQRTEPT